MDLYKQELMDHYRYPRNRGTLGNFNFSFELLNPSCGDSISVQGFIQDSILTEIAYTGEGCVISQASASMITEDIKKKNILTIQNLNKDNIFDIIGISLGPVRMRCALMILQAIQNGIAQYLISNN